MGCAAGAIGSLAGLGGGFLVVPILRMAFAIAPASVAGTALVMVLANSLSGTQAYLRQGKVDVRSGLLIAATGIPGSILGTALVRHISFTGFDVVYGVLLAYLSWDLLRRAHDKRDAPAQPAGGSLATLLAGGALMGVASSFFGIGGGLFVIPTLLLLGMPAHVVTATSTFAIALTAPVGIVTHQLAHDIAWNFAIPLAIGGMLGGQIGPRVAKHLSSPQLLKATALMLLAAAGMLVLRHL
jgi:uncharacterized membrane protein YfcA